MPDKNFQLDSQLIKDCVEIGNLKLCTVLLHKDANYLWLILVPQINGISEIFDLNGENRAFMFEEINFVAKKLKTSFQADKINIAALGNQVVQLHIHIIARYKNDLAWPNPIWGQFPPQKYSPQGLNQLITKLQQELTI